ncbi:hypothetical protein ABK040_007944 [Willaertia magna]
MKKSPSKKITVSPTITLANLSGSNNINKKKYMSQHTLSSNNSSHYLRKNLKSIATTTSATTTNVKKYNNNNARSNSTNNTNTNNNNSSNNNGAIELLMQHSYHTKSVSSCYNSTTNTKQQRNRTPAPNTNLHTTNNHTNAYALREMKRKNSSTTTPLKDLNTISTNNNNNSNNNGSNNNSRYSTNNNNNNTITTTTTPTILRKKLEGIITTTATPTTTAATGNNKFTFSTNNNNNNRKTDYTSKQLTPNTKSKTNYCSPHWSTKTSASSSSSGSSSSTTNSSYYSLHHGLSSSNNSMSSRTSSLSSLNSISSNLTTPRSNNVLSNNSSKSSMTSTPGSNRNSGGNSRYEAYSKNYSDFKKDYISSRMMQDEDDLIVTNDDSSFEISNNLSDKDYVSDSSGDEKENLNNIDSNDNNNSSDWKIRLNLFKEEKDKRSKQQQQKLTTTVTSQTTAAAPQLPQSQSQQYNNNHSNSNANNRNTKRPTSIRQNDYNNESLPRINQTNRRIEAIKLYSSPKGNNNTYNNNIALNPGELSSLPTAPRLGKRIITNNPNNYNGIKYFNSGSNNNSQNSSNNNNNSQYSQTSDNESLFSSCSSSQLSSNNNNNISSQSNNNNYQMRYPSIGKKQLENNQLKKESNIVENLTNYHKQVNDNNYSNNNNGGSNENNYYQSFFVPETPPLVFNRECSSNYRQEFPILPTTNTISFSEIFSNNNNELDNNLMDYNHCGLPVQEEEKEIGYEPSSSLVKNYTSSSLVQYIANNHSDSSPLFQFYDNNIETSKIDKRVDESDMIDSTFQSIYNKLMEDEEFEDITSDNNNSLTTINNINNSTMKQLKNEIHVTISEISIEMLMTNEKANNSSDSIQIKEFSIISIISNCLNHLFLNGKDETKCFLEKMLFIITDRADIDHRCLIATLYYMIKLTNPNLLNNYLLSPSLASLEIPSTVWKNEEKNRNNTKESIMIDDTSFIHIFCICLMTASKMNEDFYYSNRSYFKLLAVTEFRMIFNAFLSIPNFNYPHDMKLLMRKGDNVPSCTTSASKGQTKQLLQYFNIMEYKIVHLLNYELCLKNSELEMLVKRLHEENDNIFSSCWN